MEKKETNEADSSPSLDEDGRRATWLETRTLEEGFNNRVYHALQELSNEGLVNPDTIKEGRQKDKQEDKQENKLEEKQEEKRGRHQGFCFRKTKSGRFLPYICWKEGDQAE